MAIRTIQYDDTIDFTWSELVYTEARLLHCPDTADLAPQMTALVGRAVQVHEGRLRVWRDEIVAQAEVDVANYNLDDTTEAVADAVFAASGKDRSAPRYRRYLKDKAPSDITRLGLETQLPVVAPWVDSLRTEPEPSLQALAARLDRDVKAGTKAVTARRTAAGAAADYRVRGIIAFIDEVNAARQLVYGVLCQRAAQLGLGRDWPKRFFRRIPASPRAREKKPDGAAPAVS